jgi:hypothetical protein
VEQVLLQYIAPVQTEGWGRVGPLGVLGWLGGLVYLELIRRGVLFEDAVWVVQL